MRLKCLNVTQNPSDPVEPNVGVAIIAETVLRAWGEFGSWEVSKNA